ncbi:MAG: hypothetical protein US89_C0007G0059 [Candidatus Peregrinibacteria bacterium GW2011_GWF2_38_29]|nr:MAG: hypothetical protein US89_C0007G0059 [Candidatus Peregrinibacteria bacterium GW2011_GWF2_38_29]HBB02874.1 hypothetical protein [Candidatus Peregrinibacteria bacterium]
MTKRHEKERTGERSRVPERIGREISEWGKDIGEGLLAKRTMSNLRFSVALIISLLLGVGLKACSEQDLGGAMDAIKSLKNEHYTMVHRISDQEKISLAQSLLNGFVKEVNIDGVFYTKAVPFADGKAIELTSANGQKSTFIIVIDDRQDR